MATLALSLRLLFAEINSVWPSRDHRTDGWNRACRWPANSSDHCPDANGIVHAIDIDKDGIRPDVVVQRIIRDHLPTEYVIWNRHIYSRRYNWRKRIYTGTKNPHTDHIHVSIRHTSAARNYNKGWGLAKGTAGFGTAPGFVEESASGWNYAPLITNTANEFGRLSVEISKVTQAMTGLRR